MWLVSVFFGSLGHKQVSVKPVVVAEYAVLCAGVCVKANQTGVGYRCVLQTPAECGGLEMLHGITERYTPWVDCLFMCAQNELCLSRGSLLTAQGG
ncbi:hypothetical protein Abor_010_143 [Acetobacter orientalis]|uniref:Uncharacterized protein n=1 Tax=Acetobacter orientalis TaxID=146474 RepID=A0A0D6NIY2_9PROT|nr:hypothetical protein Abor_010_143 [Acetobacter orientalis]